MSRKTICLNMIVKNEAHVIQRCIDSLRSVIDAWVIVDTGSTDGTQDVIRRALSGVPGQLHERPWKSFAHNRTEALQLARGVADYLLFMDADDALELEPGFTLPELTHDAYEGRVEYGSLTYYRVSLVDSRLPWRYVGALHEYLACDVGFSRARLDGLKTRIIGGGARSLLGQREKFLRDAELLERELAREPGNTRNTFYLAQSYRDAGELERALAVYERRATLGGFDQEVYCALLEAARLALRLGRPDAEIIARFLRAYEARPSRVEALGELAVYFRTQGRRWPLAHLFASKALEVPLSDDALFVEHPWHQWRCLDELAIAAYWLGDYTASRAACEQLLRGAHLPAEQRPRVIANLNFALAKLGLPKWVETTRCASLPSAADRCASA